MLLVVRVSEVLVSEQISYEQKHDIRVITLNDPDNRNSLFGDMLDRFAETLQRLQNDSQARAAVLTGAGSAFCAGANLKRIAATDGLVNLPTEEVRSFYRTTVHRVVLALTELEVPIIAAVNGPAYGAGCDIACMCDIRIASQTAEFCEAFVKLGVTPGDGGAWFMPRIIGPDHYAEMAFTGEPIDAQQALAWGLVSRVVRPEQLMSEALALAERIAANAPLALRMTKQLIRDGQQSPFASHLELCSALNAIAHGTADHREAVQSYLNKRLPTFTGA